MADMAMHSLTFGPGVLYLMVTLGQIRACGGLKAWKRGAFGATKPDEADKLERDLDAMRTRFEERKDIGDNMD